jgi:hypothetical protein
VNAERRLLRPSSVWPDFEFFPPNSYQTARSPAPLDVCGACFEQHERFAEPIREGEAHKFISAILDQAVEVAARWAAVFENHAQSMTSSAMVILIPTRFRARLPYCDYGECNLQRRALCGLTGSRLPRLEQTLRIELSFQRRRRWMFVAAAIAGQLVLVPHTACAENLFDFFFGGFQKQWQRQAPLQASFFNDLFNNRPQTQLPRPAVGSSGPAFCVRSCDGRYFPLMRGGASPAQMCQAFCPASPTMVFFGSSIDGAYAASGERYADSKNAYAYRKALRADCTCNGRDPAGLAPVDLALDGSLRPGDLVATANGLVAYSGAGVGND